MFLAAAPIIAVKNVVKSGVKAAAHTALAAGKMAAKGAFAATKMAAKGALAAGEMAASATVAAGKNAIHSAGESMKSKESGPGPGPGPGPTDNTGTPWPTNDRISGGDIETLVTKMYPDLKECLCNSMAKMFTDSSPKLTSVVITEVENTLKTNPEIRAHIENRVTLIADSVLKEKSTKDLIIKSLTTECKTNVNPTLPNPSNNPVPVPARTNGGTRKHRMGKRASVPCSLLTPKLGGTRRFIKYKREIGKGVNSIILRPLVADRTTKKRFQTKNRTGKLPRMK